MPRRKQRQSNMMESDPRWYSHYLVLGPVTQARHRCKTCDARAPSPGCSFPFHSPQTTSLSPAYKYQLHWCKWASPILKHNQNVKDQNQCLGKDSETGSFWSDSEGVPCVRCRAMSPHLWPGVPGHWPLDWGLSSLSIPFLCVSWAPHTQGQGPDGNMFQPAERAPVPLASRTLSPPHPHQAIICSSQQMILPSSKMLPRGKSQGFSNIQLNTKSSISTSTCILNLSTSLHPHCCYFTSAHDFLSTLTRPQSWFFYSVIYTADWGSFLQ